MNGYKHPDFQQRQGDAMAARKALLERFKVASTDPVIAERIAERAVISAARQARSSARPMAPKSTHRLSRRGSSASRR